jgi:hypothetical protein
VRVTTVTRRRTNFLRGIGHARSGKTMSLVDNINKRKKAGTSRSKKKTTVSNKSYAEMKAGHPNSKKKKTKK